MDDDMSTNIEKLEIYAVATDDDNRKATLFRFGRARVVIDNDDFVDGVSRTRKRLQDLVGSVISTPDFNAIVSRCKAAKIDNGVLGVTRPGFERTDTGFPRFYVFPDGSVITPAKSELEIIPMFEKNSAASSKGDFDTYMRELGPMIKNQPIPIAIFFFALAPILQPLVKGVMNVENVIIELVGATSTFKSTLTNQLAGSVWGGSGTKLGYASSWNATPNAVEHMCRNYNNCLLVLDEATAAGATPKSRADNILNTAHRISLGRSKARLGGEEPVSYELMALSNSNEPLAGILASSGGVSSAMEVRILTFDCAHPKHGYLNPIVGHDGVSASIGPQLRALCTNHYGHVAPLFIKSVLRACAHDFVGFKNKIARYMQRFLDHFRVTAQDEKALRQAKPFALVYACAKLADDFMITDDTWGKTGAAISKAFHKFLRQSVPSSRYDVVKRFLYDPTKKILDRRNSSSRKMTNVQFDAVDGFIVNVRGAKALAISPNALKRNFSDTHELIKDLDRESRLITNEGKQFKKSVRADNQGLRVKDRFYIIKIAKWPKRFRDKEVV